MRHQSYFSFVLLKDNGHNAIAMLLLANGAEITVRGGVRMDTDTKAKRDAFFAEKNAKASAIELKRQREYLPV